MITLVFTYRNREIEIVKKCLQSLASQSNPDFCVILVNYGSNSNHSGQIEKIIEVFSFVKYIRCDVSGQLWNKSRAINIALKTCNTPFFFVGDIDMIFRNDFVGHLHELKNADEAIYFQVGFLNESESTLDKPFDEYLIKHKSNNEATGMTLYPTPLLKEINGYDEFYHGWGAEDTDVHIRLNNKGVKVNFYKNELFILHQWHLRDYRTNQSKEPYHSELEYINHRYISSVVKNKIVKANIKFDFGLLPDSKFYSLLKSADKTIYVNNEKNEIDAFLNGTLNNLPEGVYEIVLQKHPKFSEIKNKLKILLRKKALRFYNMDKVNNLVLLQLINNFRNHPYHFEYDKNEQRITLKIKL